MNKKSYATHHIKADKGDISKTVIMMGDPTRAKKFAGLYLENPKLICDIRGINIWTGLYNGHKITFMGHGMGLSSLAIYAHELFEFFEVETIIRLGSSASYSEDVKIGDIIIGDNYYTHSLFGEGYGLDCEEPISATKELVSMFSDSFKDEDVRYIVGGLYSSLWFYAPSFFGEGIKKDSTADIALKEGNIIGKEMESYSLQVIANHFKKSAITIVTVIDNLKTKEFSSENNKVDTSKMGEIVLKALFR